MMDKEEKQIEGQLRTSLHGSSLSNFMDIAFSKSESKHAKHWGLKIPYRAAKRAAVSLARM